MYKHPHRGKEFNYLTPQLPNISITTPVLPSPCPFIITNPILPTLPLVIKNHFLQTPPPWLTNHRQKAKN